MAMDPVSSEGGRGHLWGAVSHTLGDPRALHAQSQPPEPSRKAAPGQGLCGGLNLAHLLAGWLWSALKLFFQEALLIKDPNARHGAPTCLPVGGVPLLLRALLLIPCRV